MAGHNREADLDAYESDDEMQQKQLSHFIDKHHWVHQKINIIMLVTYCYETKVFRYSDDICTFVEPPNDKVIITK